MARLRRSRLLSEATCTELAVTGDFAGNYSMDGTYRGKMDFFSDTGEYNLYFETVESRRALREDVDTQGKKRLLPGDGEKCSPPPFSCPLVLVVEHGIHADILNERSLQVIHLRIFFDFVLPYKLLVPQTKICDTKFMSSNVRSKVIEDWLFHQTGGYSPQDDYMWLFIL